MFDVGWSEMLVVGAVALIVIGPKDLPGALRTLGQSVGKIRRMAGEFRQQFDDAMREAEIDKIKQDLAKAEEDARAAADFNFDPVSDAKSEISSAIAEADKKAQAPQPLEAAAPESMAPTAPAPVPPVSEFAKPGEPAKIPEPAQPRKGADA
jgi:sec-independent protein translocase protein TatB